jgi:putative phage-type endonuclease
MPQEMIMSTQSLQKFSTTPRPALRLVGTKQLPREDWLAVRKLGIGSSDAAAAVGLNPYKSQLELWMEKTGRDESLPKLDPQDEESPAYWGNILEPIVAAHTPSVAVTGCDGSMPCCNTRLRS